MTMVRAIAVILMAAGMAGHSRVAFDVQWASDLKLARLSDASERLRAPFDAPVMLRSGSRSVEAGNCAALLRYQRAGFAPLSDRDRAVTQSLLVDCFAVEALSRAKKARVSFLRTLRLTPESLEVLPPTVAPIISDEDRQNAVDAASKGLSWKQFDPSATASGKGDAITVLSDDTQTIVKICGRGDFNGDGIDDLLLRVDTAALHGTYRVSRLLLLTKTRSGGPIRMIREFT